MMVNVYSGGERLSGGRRHAVHLVRQGDERFVVKTGSGLLKDESAALVYWKGHALPVPTVLEISDGLLRLEAIMVDDQPAPTLASIVTGNPQIAPETGIGMATLLKQIHAVPLDPSIVSKDEKRVIADLGNQNQEYLQHLGITPAVFSALGHRYSALSQKDGQVLLHGDFRSANVLVGPTGWVIIDPDPFAGNRHLDLAEAKNIAQMGCRILENTSVPERYQQSLVTDVALNKSLVAQYFKDEPYDGELATLACFFTLLRRIAFRETRITEAIHRNPEHEAFYNRVKDQQRQYLMSLTAF